MFKNESEGFGCVGTITLLGLGVVLGTVVNGWALSMLWGWFIVPIFEAPPPLSCPSHRSCDGCVFSNVQFAI